MPKMPDRILIANRGRVACRIARTCRELGIHAIGVHSDADADTAHVRTCDESWRLGPASPAESYLHPGRILEAALRSGAQAIHPGTGFLAEDTGFARACQRAGITFIGPPPECMEAMRNRATARVRMQQADVPLVPGYHGDETTAKRLRKEADALGFPLVIKAAAGGGGEGMHRVETGEDLANALKPARREARQAFGDDRLLLETWLPDVRRIELQFLADRHGDIACLHDRDASLQNRCQTLIDEAPAPNLSADCRNRMARAAARAARAIGYVGAGTLVFLVDPQERCHFLTMTTRLQIGHAVTEMITGHDLVEWQIRVAAGQRLPFACTRCERRGHAIQFRIRAENPGREFAPSSGMIQRVELPPNDAHVRIETGIAEGDTIASQHHPTLATLAVHGEDRNDALRRARYALDRFHVSGPATNLRLLRRLVNHPAWSSGDVSTDFLRHHANSLLSGGETPCIGGLAAACLAVLRPRTGESPKRKGNHGPWVRLLRLQYGERDIEVTATRAADGGYCLDLPGGKRHVRGWWRQPGDLVVAMEDMRFRVGIIHTGREMTVLGFGVEYKLDIVEADAGHAEIEGRGQ